MTIPFTAEQFYGVFRDYNDAVWPAQFFLVALALAAVALALRRLRWSGVGVSAILGFLWAWIAVVYHLAFFTRISSPAYAFAVVSMAGAAVFVWQGVIRRRLEFRWAPGWRSASGVALIVFALVVYPVWSAFVGHRYPATATFGLPCPTTIFTLGVLAFAARPYPRSPLIAPLLWCFVGAQAAFLLNVPADLGLIAAAVVGIGLLVTARQQSRASTS
jgi:Family of unknown function (DUF6064)